MNRNEENERKRSGEDVIGSEDAKKRSGEDDRMREIEVEKIKRREEGRLP